MSDKNALDTATANFESADSAWQAAQAADSAAQATVTSDAAAVTALQTQVTAATTALTGDQNSEAAAKAQLLTFINSVPAPGAIVTSNLDANTFNGDCTGWMNAYAAVVADNVALVALTNQLTTAQAKLAADTNIQTTTTGPAVASALAARTAAYQALLAVVQGDANG